MKLIIGRAGTGKTYTCMNEIKENVINECEKSLIYIVPEQFSFEAEKELINVIGSSGIINTEVLSFKRLAYRIFAEQNVEEEYIEEPGKAMLIYWIIQKLKDRLIVLKNADKKPGVIDTVVDAIAEFKRYNVLPENLNVEVKNELLKNKLSDLKLIYEEFEKQIKDKCIDQNDQLSILSALIPKSKLLKSSKIWIDEFDGFTKQEYRIIEELEKVADVTITINSDNINESLFMLNNKTKHTIYELSKNVKIRKLNEVHRYKNIELSHLEQNIYVYPYKKYEGNIEHITISKSENAYTEIEEVANKIIEYVRDKNIRYENISILTRNLENYKNIIEMVFDLYKIPYFLDDKRGLSAQPLIALILMLLEICEKGYMYEYIFSYLKTGYTNIEDENDIDIVENYVLKYGIKGTTWLKEWTLEDENLEKINIIRQEIINPITEFKESLAGRKTIKEINDAIYAYLIKIGAYRKIQNKVEYLRKSKDDKLRERANEYVQVWNILMKIFEEIVMALGDEKVTFEEYKNIINIGISKHEIGIIPPSKDKVTIGDVQRTRSNDTKKLFIIGVVDGIFPMPFESEGFINDDDRTTLKSSGLELAKDTKTLLFEENFNIYKALSTASEDLHISYPIATLKGETVRPSNIISHIKKIFPMIKEETFIKEETNISTKDSTFVKMLQHIRKYADTNEIENIWKESYTWYKENENEKLNKIIKGIDYKNTIENADKKVISTLYGNEIKASVSKLEKFSLCPFSYFIKYGLNAKERKKYTIEAPDIGSFLHEIIDKFSKYIIENNIVWRELEKEECDKIVDSITEDVLKDFKDNLMNSTGRLRRLAIKLKRLVKRMIWTITTHIKLGEFTPIGSEVEFGENKKIPAIELELPENKKIILNGKIDRIDIAKTEDGDFIRIIDYKSSNKEINLSNVYYGLQLQLLAYLDVAQSDDLISGGVLYLKLDDPMIKKSKDVSIEEIEKEIVQRLKMKGLILADARLIKAMDKDMIKDSSVLSLGIKNDGTYTKMPVATKEEFEKLRKHIRFILKQIGSEIINGNVKNEPVKTKGTNACEYCEYMSICGFDKQLGNKCKYLNPLKDEEIWTKLQ